MGKGVHVKKGWRDIEPSLSDRHIFSQLKQETYMDTTQKLKEFYKEYAYWLDNGAEEDHPIFSRDGGLCANLSRWVTPVAGTILHLEMQKQFRLAGLDIFLPFNYVKGKNPHAIPYGKECVLGVCHINPERVNWVREHVEEGVV